MGYLRRQLVVGALAANAVRPRPTYYTGVPTMLAGWLVSELSPHVMTGVALDTAVELVRGDRRRALLGAANLALLGTSWWQTRGSDKEFDRALAEVLGEDYRARLQARYAEVDWDWRTPARQLLWPFSHRVRPDVEVVRDVAYAPEHGRRGLLDVYRPKGEVAGAPVLLQVHGGGWTMLDKDGQGLPLMQHMASRGWVCVAINYRLAPRDPFPAQIVDVKRAIAWIREHAGDYGADPAFVAVTGGSAGGHLAALAALTPGDPEWQPGFEDADTSVQAAVPFYGVYDLAGATGSKVAVTMRDRFLGPRIFRRDPAADLEPFRKASPLLRVNAGAPPFYVIHGTNDTLVDVAQARAFVAALRAVSREPVAYTELHGTHHSFDVFPSVRSQSSVRHVERFLRWSYNAWRGEPVADAAVWEESDPQDHPEQHHEDAVDSGPEPAGRDVPVA